MLLLSLKHIIWIFVASSIAAKEIILKDTELGAYHAKLFCDAEGSPRDFRISYTPTLESKWELLSKSNVAISSYYEGWYKCEARYEEASVKWVISDSIYIKLEKGDILPHDKSLKILFSDGENVSLECKSSKKGKACLWYETTYHSTGSTTINTVALSHETIQDYPKFTLEDKPEIGICSLAISNAQRHDQANLTCVIEPSILIKDFDLIYGKARQSPTPKNDVDTQFLAIGQAHTIPCRASSGEGCIWIRPLKDITGRDEIEIVAMSNQNVPFYPTYELDDNPQKGICDLTITDVETTDAGALICNIEPMVASLEYNLVVKNISVILKYEGPDNFKPGDSGKLTCVAHGFADESHYRISYMEADNWNVIKNGKDVEINKPGEYLCEASSDSFPTWVKSNVVEVKSKTDKNASAVLYYEGPEKLKPGDLGKLFCVAQNFQSSVSYQIWYTPFKVDEEFLISNEDNVTISEGGQYQCVVKESGTSKSVVSNIINVYADDFYMLYDSKMLDDKKKYPLEFEKSTEIELTCVSKSTSDNPVLTWYIDGVEVDADVQYTNHSHAVTTTVSLLRVHINEADYGSSCSEFFRTQPEVEIRCQDKKINKQLTVYFGKGYATTEMEIIIGEEDHKIDCVGDGIPEPDKVVVLYKSSLKECWTELIDNISAVRPGYYRCLGKNSFNDQWIPSIVKRATLCIV